MKISTYDRFSSMLIALLILGVTGVAILLGLWLTSRAFGRPTAVPVTLVPRGDGAGTDSETVDPDVLEPGLDLEQDEPTLLDALESVVDIVSEHAALFSDVSPMDDSLLTPGGKMGEGRIRGEGIGLTGRVRRWEFQFPQGITVDQYAAILDYFEIELGVLRPGGKVVYISRLASARPTIREGETADEKRYYLTWLKGKGDTESADRELLEKAKVSSQGRLILKFLPQALEAELEAKEREYAQDRERGIKGSYFRITRDGNGYRFDVYYQVY